MRKVNGWEERRVKRGKSVSMDLEEGLKVMLLRYNERSEKAEKILSLQR